MACCLGEEMRFETENSLMGQVIWFGPEGGQQTTYVPESMDVYHTCTVTYRDEKRYEYPWKWSYRWLRVTVRVLGTKPW